MRRLMDLIGACVTFAWWDGSCLGLRLHRLPDLIDRVAAGPRPAVARAAGLCGPEDRR
ncbi:hypothetical protein [uncultured Methylobacterium sp.]|uniref:hypothetical protein n=1 Tax=uncultured Methylobacterium sp. TaxID=157278 RepID=UPI0035CB8A32